MKIGPLLRPVGLGAPTVEQQASDLESAAKQSMQQGLAALAAARKSAQDASASTRQSIEAERAAAARESAQLHVAAQAEWSAALQSRRRHRAVLLPLLALAGVAAAWGGVRAALAPSRP